jgi:hypothetical protein
MFHKSKKFTFKSKAATLLALRGRLSLSSIPKLFAFTVREWKQNSAGVLRRIRENFKDDLIVVRSSGNGEDNELSSKAGFFHSVLGVHSSSDYEVRAAINKVVKSYKRHKFSEEGLDQVFAQKMVENVSMSGVLFTQDMNTGAPYYVINYDDQSGKTDTVTSGKEYSNRTLFVSRIAVDKLHSPRFKNLLRAAEELEFVTGMDTLDIEYAVDAKDGVHIFQVRPISTKANWNRGITLHVNDSIQRVKDFVEERFKPLPHVFGSKSIFGQMSDWNPAEMIGNCPRPLAFSLYRKLITDRIWRLARGRMGYAEPRGANLITSLGGRPYVDVRYSFHSFLPSGIKPNIANKLVDAWVERLSLHRELHDKIEFEIALTAYLPDFKETMASLYPGLLSKDELRAYAKSLLVLTKRLIGQKICALKDELAQIETLERIRVELIHERLQSDICTARALLEACVEYGTLPFSILARHAFIASAFLRFLVRKHILTERDMAVFQRSVLTVATEFINDLHAIKKDENSRQAFLEKYGHLRPGTYDILSLRYDQRENWIRPDGKPKIPKKKTFKLTEIQNNVITKFLKKSGFDISGFELFDYIAGAIIAREHSKFVFTHAISDALEIIALWGKRHGLSREEISYIPIDMLLDSETVAEDRTVELYLRRQYEAKKQEHDIAMSIHLPLVINDPNDVLIAPLLLSRPNFITKKAVGGELLRIDGQFENIELLDNKILLIEGADPGYDWIFARPIKGLITKFGGANSHMAIRCAEFGLPAAIGCGEQIFDRLSKALFVELDCGEQQIVPLEY